jgi:transposase, IS5 family
VIGHEKTDGRLDRNFLAGARGDGVNALLCATCYNLRLILNWLGCLLCTLLQLSLSVTSRLDRAIRQAADPEPS